MTGYRWRCQTSGCTWTGVDAPAVLAHRDKTGHVGAEPHFGKPCDCDHCRHRTNATICDCGHVLAEHQEPFHSCGRCLWCDAFRQPRPGRQETAA